MHVLVTFSVVTFVQYALYDTMCGLKQVKVSLFKFGSMIVGVGDTQVKDLFHFLFNSLLYMTIVLTMARFKKFDMCVDALGDK